MSAPSKLQKASESYWSDRTDAGHRTPVEESFRAQAGELLGLVSTGGVLIDVGCGSCQVTSYLAPHFTKVFGLDFSESMLGAARERLQSMGIENVELTRDLLSAFRPSAAPDVILLHAVVQYFTRQDLAEHLAQCRSLLKPGGIVCLGMVPDVARRDVFYYGFLVGDRYRTLPRLRGWIDLTVRRAKAWLRRDPFWDGVGTWFSDLEIRQLAAAAGFSTKTHGAAYSDYRFHAVLRAEG